MADPGAGEIGLGGLLLSLVALAGKAWLSKMRRDRDFKAEVAKADLLEVETKRDHNRELLGEYKAAIIELKAELKAVRAEVEQLRRERLELDSAIRNLQAQLSHALARVQYSETKAEQLLDLNNRYRGELAQAREEKKRTDPPSSPEASTGDLSGPFRPIKRVKR